MLRMFRSEWLKIRLPVVRLLAFAGAALVLMLAQFLLKRQDDFPWNQAMAIVSVMHAMLFLPLLTGVYAALICRYEHGGGGWKAMLAMPVTRTQVYVVKLAVVMLLLAFTQLLLFAAVLIYGASHGTGPIPWRMLFVSFAGGWVACLPLAALQLFVSTALQSFAAPLAINVILTLPNILVVNSSTYAPLDPWAQPMLAMIPRDGGGMVELSPERLYLVVLISFCAFFAAGWTYFSRRSA